MPFERFAIAFTYVYFTYIFNVKGRSPNYGFYVNILVSRPNDDLSLGSKIVVV